MRFVCVIYDVSLPLVNSKFDEGRGHCSHGSIPDSHHECCRIIGIQCMSVLSRYHLSLARPQIEIGGKPILYNFDTLFYMGKKKTPWPNKFGKHKVR